MLSSKLKQFSLSDMPVLGLFIASFFSTPESADGRNFSGSKDLRFTNVESVRNFARVIFQGEMFYSKFCKNAKF